MVDNDNRIWIRTTLARNRWLVLNPDAAPLACLDAPTDVRITAAAGDRAWAIHTDADGVQALRRYRLTLR